MLEELKELLLIIFSQDRDSLATIKTSLGEETAKQYPVPPENIDEMIKTIGITPRVEVVDVGILEEEEEYTNIKFPKYSNWIMFKISDVRIKRRKIYRLGDYYVKLFHSGLNKWNFIFFTKSRIMLESDNIAFIDHYYEAQHPHIHSGKPCLGGFNTPLRAALTNYYLDSFIWNIKLYLDDWNYRSPHHYPERFEFINCQMINSEHLIPLLLNKMNISRYMMSFNITEPSDVYLFETKGLTSARCKDYETEPLSRIVMEQFYWNDDNAKYRIDSFFMYNIEKYIRVKFVENNIQFAHLHDSILFVKSLYTLIWDIAKAQLQLNNYEWTNNNNDMLMDTKKCKRNLLYYTNSRRDEDTKSAYNDSYLYYLKNDENQSDDIKNGCRRLQFLIDKLENIKYSCDSDEPPHYKVKERTYELFGNMFSNPDCFKTKESIYNLINNIEVKPEGENITKQKIDDLYKEFIGLQSILNQAMNNWIINYHETELRRLTNGKPKIDIENLNI